MAETIPGIDDTLGITGFEPIIHQTAASGEGLTLGEGGFLSPNTEADEPLPGIDEEILEIAVGRWRNCEDDDASLARKRALRLQAVMAARTLQATTVNRFVGQQESGLSPEPQLLPRVIRSVPDLTQDAVVAMDNDLRRRRMALRRVIGNDSVYALSLL